MVIDNFLNKLINFTKLQISILERVDIFSDLESKLNTKILKILPDFGLDYISIVVKFDKKLTNDDKQKNIPKLSTKYDFSIIFIEDTQIIIKFKNPIKH